MKKRLQYCLAILFLLAFLFRMDGQITITSDNFIRAATFTDSIYSTLIDESFASPTIGENQIWDYSDLFVDSLYIRDHFDASGDVDFSGAHNVFQNDRIFQGFIIPTLDYEGIDDIGWYPLGKASEDISYSIAGITGGPNDILRFPPFNNLFEGRLTYVKFPTNYGDNWDDQYIQKTNFEISVAAFGLNKTPGLYKTRVTENRSVEGYGQLILPSVTGYESTPIDVLMIKVNRTIIDSTFLGGAPAPPALLAAFGLIQGDVDYETIYIFYSQGFGYPVLSILEGDPEIFYRPRANGALSTSTVEASTYKASNFPNPISKGQTLSIYVENQVGNVKVDFIDLSGKKIYSIRTSSLDGNKVNLKIPNKMNSGLYFYSVEDEESGLISVGKVLVD